MAIVLLFFLFLIGTLVADEQGTYHVPADETFQPWFTGPLIAPSGYTVDPGHVNLQPYLFVRTNRGFFTPEWHFEREPNFYISTLLVQTKIGICDWLDFHFTPQIYYKNTQGVGTFSFGDLPILFNFQLLDAETDDPWPAIKLGLRANIPSGKYQHLNGSKLQTDIGGSGNWEPGPTVTVAKLWNTSQNHFLEARLSLSYRFGISVHVKGFNTYGGLKSTLGTVYPGNQFLVDGSIQYNFNQRWAFASDFIYIHTDKNNFSGRIGDLSEESSGSISSLSVEQFSLAPAIEYNLSKNLGFIGGVWFSFAGRNGTQFISGVLSFNARI